MKRACLGMLLVSSKTGFGIEYRPGRPEDLCPPALSSLPLLFFSIIFANAMETNSGVTVGTGLKFMKPTRRTYFLKEDGSGPVTWVNLPPHFPV